MDNLVKKLQPEINPSTFKDKRGIIKTFYPCNDNIVEWNYIVTNKNVTRGYHYHKEFDEYIMFVEGEGVYTTLNEENIEEIVPIGAGECLFIPKFTPHTFYPTTDCKMIALITKKWNDCKEPITKVDQ